MRIIIRILALVFLVILTAHAFSQPSTWKGKFEQLENVLPTPNSYRTGSGAPGPRYWQQRADYEIEAIVNDETQELTGREKITYYNYSPETLRFIWLQLDQNIFAEGSIAEKTQTGFVVDSLPAGLLTEISGLYASDYKGGFKIGSVVDATGKQLSYTINNTMMRIDLPSPLKQNDIFVFNIEWSYRESDRQRYDGRGGYEFFPEDGNYVYTFAQWFPRMCVFDDFEGWQNKQFLGRGEFALTFGNYQVKITVPADHIVGATGWLQNPAEVLSKDQLDRFRKAQKEYDKPVFIVTEREARQKEKSRSSANNTWVFHAENVRDFAFATSRKFIWDAMSVKLGENQSTLAQSLYPKEGNPLWEKESTKAIKNTLELYSERTFTYPYPTAYSVHSADQGMEYPMICFNHGRPNKDGRYSLQTLAGMVQVIVHEIGHNFFPMIVNSDERQWSWMDEGLNTFLEKETLRLRYPELSASRGTPMAIAAFMRGDKSQMRPIMSSSDNIRQEEFGPNAYYKPSAALTVLREQVMGPELFDEAFREYARRWAFKHPRPADFFRTMEDASAVDLDWFWRGWFYTTDHVDVEIADVKWFRIKSDFADPERKSINVSSGDLSGNNATASKRDFSEGPQELTLSNTPASLYGEFRNSIDDRSIREKLKNKHIYEVTLLNRGGLVTPLVIQWTYKDGTQETERIPAEIWRLNEQVVTKVFVKDKEVTNVVFDPNLDLADVNVRNNSFPRSNVTRFDTFRRSR